MRGSWYPGYCWDEHTVYFPKAGFVTIAAVEVHKHVWFLFCGSVVLPIPFRARVVVPPHVLLQQVGEESVLLDLKTECYFGLDPVGTRMWQALMKAETIEAAYQELIGAYEVDAQRLRQDLEELIAKLVEKGLLETSDE